MIVAFPAPLSHISLEILQQPSCMHRAPHQCSQCLGAQHQAPLSQPAGVARGITTCSVSPFQLKSWV